MTSEPIVTTGRQSRDDVVDGLSDISSMTLISQVLDSIPDVCLIVDGERRIVFANRAVLGFMGTDDRSSVSGLRLGDVLNCVHASETDSGCGTTASCAMCGGLNSMLTIRSGAEDARECRITADDGQVMDLKVWAAPVVIENQAYTMLTVTDISHEKRRRVLERVFFHDILNTAGAIRGFSELLTRKPAEEHDKFGHRIARLSKRLIEEINAQKDLMDAENAELLVSPAKVVTADLLAEVVAGRGEQMGPKGPTIRIDPASQSIVFRSDPTLLRRIIENLLKNAIEASDEGDEVTVGTHLVGKSVEFRIHNRVAMTHEVQLQVFQRSFSTKGPGRGLGTYGARLLTERYLKGRVSFTTSTESGTRFTAAYPLNLE